MRGLRCASLLECGGKAIASLQSVFQRRAHLRPVARRFDCALFHAPLAWPELRQQLRLQAKQGPAEHERQIAQLAVVWEKRDHHLEVGDEADGFKGQPL